MSWENQILAAILAHAPALLTHFLTHLSAKILIPCILQWFFLNGGVPMSPENIANLCPNKETLSTLIINVRKNIISDLKSQLSGVSDVYLACDKGNK